MAETTTATTENGAESTTNGADSEKGMVSELQALVDRLEGRVRKLVDETGEETLADGRRRIQENPLTAVLMALGLGLLLGLIFGGRRG